MLWECKPLYKWQRRTRSVWMCDGEEAFLEDTSLRWMKGMSVWYTFSPTGITAQEWASVGVKVNEMIQDPYSDDCSSVWVVTRSWERAVQIFDCSRTLLQGVAQ